MDSSFPCHPGEAQPPRPEKAWFFGVPTPLARDYVAPEELIQNAILDSSSAAPAVSCHCDVGNVRWPLPRSR